MIQLDASQVAKSFFAENEKFSWKSFVSSENSRTFASAFRETPGSMKKEFFESLT